MQVQILPTTDGGDTVFIGMHLDHGELERLEVGVVSKTGDYVVSDERSLPTFIPSDPHETLSTTILRWLRSGRTTTGLSPW